MKSFVKFLLLLFFTAGNLRGYAQQENIEATIANPGGPQFSFITKQVYDFGEITLHSNASYEFQFKNTGNQPLVITDMHGGAKGTNEPTCDIEIKYPKHPIKPGKKGNISIKLTAQDDIGSFDREIYVTSNATTGNFPLLQIKGAVIPPIHDGGRVLQPDVQAYNNPGAVPVYPAKGK